MPLRKIHHPNFTAAFLLVRFFKKNKNKSAVRLGDKWCFAPGHWDAVGAIRYVKTGMSSMYSQKWHQAASARTIYSLTWPGRGSRQGPPRLAGACTVLVYLLNSMRCDPTAPTYFRPKKKRKNSNAGRCMHECVLPACMLMSQRFSNT